MSRVPWASLDAGTVEALVGHLLARRHPNSVRLKPGRGDGGIDIFVPLGGRRVHVHQVKHFTGPIQWNKVKESLDRAAANEHVQIEKWMLTVPRQPTPNDVEKLRELDATVPFPCEWFDGDHIDGLAADFPASIEYHLGDGKARLEDSIARLHNLAGLAPSVSGAVLEPGQATPWLSGLSEALNRDDPHFRYEFHVGAAPTLPPNDTPWLVAAAAQPVSGGYVTFHIFGRYNGATDDRPTPLTFTINPDGMAPELIEAWRRTLRYGTPIEFPASAIAGVQADLPGGLGTNAAEAIVRISPALPQPTDVQLDRLRLTITGSDGEVVAQAVIEVTERTRGLLEPGVRMIGRSLGGAFQIEVLTDLDKPGDAVPGSEQEAPPFRVNFNLSRRDWTGLSPSALLPEAHFLQALRAPNSLRVGTEHGPPTSATAQFTETYGGASDWECLMVESLAELQQQLDGRVRVPDFENLSDDEATAICRAAHLVSGKPIVEEWQDAVSLPELPEPDDTSPVSVYGVKPETVIVDGMSLQLDVKYTWFDVEVTHDAAGATITPANPPGRLRIERA